MTSLTLKKESGKTVTMYGFKGKYDWQKHIEYNPKSEEIFFGSKDSLLHRDEEFWKPLVRKHESYSFDAFQSYDCSGWFENTAKESGLSAIEKLTENNYLLIVETKE
jgi:hypothetical protein